MAVESWLKVVKLRGNHGKIMGITWLTAVNDFDYGG